MTISWCWTATRNLIERTFARLAKGGLFNVVTDEARVRAACSLTSAACITTILGVIGATDGDLSSAYRPIRTQLKPGGQTCGSWAQGGPMGHMHLQRALEIDDRPRKIVATNLHLARIAAIEDKFAPHGRSRTTSNWSTIRRSPSPSPEQLLDRLLEETDGQGFDDIAVMAPSVSAVEMAMAIHGRSTV